MAQAEEGQSQAAASKAAEEFAAFWEGRGEEKQETQRFWIGLLQDVLGAVNATRIIDFEKRVKIGSTKYIDGYIAETKTIIEQKGAKIDLDAAEAQSDGRELTPFEQAKRYDDNLPYSERARWIVVSNFTEIRVHDMEREEPEKHYERIMLADLPKERYRLAFFVDQKNENIRREEDLSLKAGRLVGRLFDALYAEYIPPQATAAGQEITAKTEGNPRGLSPFQLRSLNILCVRTVFCLYAEDAGLFATRTAFEDYIKGFSLPAARTALMKLFQALDTPIGERDQYEQALEPFPYVNGGLFKDEQIEIPNFTQEIVDVIVNECAPFNWSEISPTIFGAVFESTLNPETRRKGGMHYTSIQNIHKVIDPLFLDGLNAEFEEICATKSAKQKTEKLHAFQKKLGSLSFLDPACGSGNFLTETYLSLRKLENRAIRLRFGGQVLMGEFENPIRVHIGQFYGIEINDFAVTVARTALWIAESQMACETEAIISQSIPFLPLANHANIIEGNALRMDWATLSKAEEEDAPRTQTEPPAPIVYDYIMGNPPFVGYTFQSDRQKEDLKIVAGDMGKNIDYVVGWYAKAARLVQNSQTKCAFVSTNSITQGEQVAEVWKPLFERNNIQFDFAYKTFRWDSESESKAHVHCVILGFSDKNSVQKEKCIFDEGGNKRRVKNINPYLLDAPTVFIGKRKTPLCAVSKIYQGSRPIDDGNLIMLPEEYDAFVTQEPDAKKFVREFLGAEEFINGKKRYCLWLVNASPAELRKMPLVMKRIEAVKQFRENSKREATRNLSAYPYLFAENRQPENGNYLLIPSVSSEKRGYVPIGFLDSSVVASNLVLIIPNATLYEFGVLTSTVHNAWMRVVCGRLKSDYRYSNDIVYNNFPWCTPSAEQKAKIERTAQGILDARAKHPDSSLADLYDEATMPPDLRRAHRENDKAVMAAYGFSPKMGEGEIVAELFKMYEKLCASFAGGKTR